MQAQFVYINALHSGALPGLEAVENAFDDAVEVEVLEPVTVRLHADPLIVVEDISLFAVLMDQVNALAPERDDEAVDKVNPVEIFLRGRVVRRSEERRV